MKTIILVLSLLISISSLSQDLREKYNSYLERYEYYDSDNRLIGYKKYNSYREEWEYFKVKNSSGYRKPVPTKDVALINKVLKAKQARYDKNHKEYYDYGASLIKNLLSYENDEQRRKAVNMFMEVIEKLDGVKIDFTDNNDVNRFKNYLRKEHNRIIEYVNNMDVSKTAPKSSSAKNYLYKTSIIDTNLPVYIIANPDLDVEDNILIECFSGDTVEVVERIDGEHYRVRKGGFVGYVERKFLINE